MKQLSEGREKERESAEELFLTRGFGSAVCPDKTISIKMDGWHGINSGILGVIPAIAYSSKTLSTEFGNTACTKLQVLFRFIHTDCATDKYTKLKTAVLVLQVSHFLKLGPVLRFHHHKFNSDDFQLLENSLAKPL